MRKSLILLAATFLVGTLGVLPAAANTLQIQFSGLNLTYDGNNIAANEDELATMNFFSDGVLVGTLTNGIGIDLLIPNIGPILTGDGSYTSGLGYGLNLWAGGGGIGLDWDSPVSVNVNELGGDVNVAVLGSASTNTVTGQNLPFGFDFDTPIQFSFSTQITNFTVGGGQGYFQGEQWVTDGGDYYTHFDSFGTGELSGEASPIPEPATLLMIGAGLLGGGLSRRRKKKENA